MTQADVITAILSLAAGIGVFLVACNTMSSNLESVSSNKLKQLFAKTEDRKFVGVGIGAIVTMLIQSSGATSVMVIGFLNAGIMSLAQAVTVIFGANIGTTITGQIVALGMFGGDSISTSAIFSALAGIGAVLMIFGKKDLLKNFGGIMTGFGMLFVGLDMMKGSMDEFAKMESIKLFLASISNPLLLILIGAVMTAIIQSSSVMTSVAISMVVTNLISLEQSIYITVGACIGACVVSVLAGMSSGVDGKRSAFIHVVFNVIAAGGFLIAGLLLALFSGGTLSFGVLFERMFPGAPQTQLAMFNTFYSIVRVAVMLPMTKGFVRLSERVIREKKAETTKSDEPRLYYLDEHMLKAPAIAVQQTKNEIVNMANIAMRNFMISLDTICRVDRTDRKEFEQNEQELNYLSKELVNVVVKLSKLKLSDPDYEYLSTTYHTIADLERVGDYAENIVEYAESLRASGDRFSPEAVDEVTHLKELIKQLFEYMLTAYTKGDASLLGKVYEVEDQIDNFTNAMQKTHIDRLNEGTCNYNAGAQYLSLASNAERAADHLVNVAERLPMQVYGH